MKKALLILFAISFSFSSKSQVITTFAGNGSITDTGDGGAATLAGLNGPSGIVFDAAGNTYITSYYSHNIRKVSPTGIISTIAGTGAAGFSGDGGSALLAQFHNPTKLILDTAGNLYVSDLSNNCIRKITPAGNISRFAGTGTPGFSGDGFAATSAELFHPTGLAIDDTGNIYISDYGNYRIRKVSTTGIITTIAGTGTPGSYGNGIAATLAQIYYVWGIKMDHSGNLYLADAQNNEVRKISAAGIITTIAGTGLAGHTGDSGLAINAELSNPSGVDIDTAGNIFIADQVNNCVRKITPAGIITTIAGTGVAGFFGDGGLPTLAEINSTNEIGFSPSGNLYICDNNNNRVRKIETCVSSIASQPVSDTVFAGDSAVYAITPVFGGSSYQWQANSGSGFVNLSNVLPYSGVNTHELIVHNTVLSLNNTQYRCIVWDESTCVDTSNGALLIVKDNTGVATILPDGINVFPNPAHGKITIHMPMNKTEANIQLINEIGQSVINQNINGTNGEIDVNNIVTGIYVLKIQSNDKVIFRKMVIN